VDYTSSKTSLNETLSILAVQIRNQICHQIATAECFSALIDESKDKGKREELAFSVRYYTTRSDKSTNHSTEKFILANKLNILHSKSMFIGDANTKPIK
jgi:hypothetical protein